MLEKFTQEELTQIIKELKDQGFTVSKTSKNTIIEEEAEGLGFHDAFIAGDLRKSIFLLADWATGNYTQTYGKTYKNKFVPKDKEEQYRKICRGVLKLVEDKYNKSSSFREFKK